MGNENKVRCIYFATCVIDGFRWELEKARYIAY